MKINELIIVESQNQLDEISLAGVGKAIAKGANVAGKAVGGVARGAVDTVRNFGQGVKQGWDATKATMAGDDTADGSQPAPQGSPAPAPQGSPAPAPQGSPAPAPEPASGADLEQLKASIGKLNPDQKKELAGELEKSINTPPAEPAAPEDEKPAYDPQTGVANAAMAAKNRAAGKEKAPYGFNPQTGEPNPPPADATATTPPADATATTPPAEPATKTRTGGKVAGQLSQTPNAIRKREARAAKAQQAAAGSGAFNQMANQLAPNTPPEEDDNPNLVRGYNENKIVGFRSKFLEMTI
jgi:hypothetical protein